jgi:hypothetical protein
MQGYHSLVPLENLAGTGERERRKFGNWNSSVYRAINSVDGGTYCLRRIESAFSFLLLRSRPKGRVLPFSHSLAFPPLFH